MKDDLAFVKKGGWMGIESTADILSLEEASQYLGVSKAAIRSWKRDGKAPAFFRAGKLLRFRKADLNRWIEDRIVAQSGQQT